jgi:hypothetical protein
VLGIAGQFPRGQAALRKLKRRVIGRCKDQSHKGLVAVRLEFLVGPHEKILVGDPPGALEFPFIIIFLIDNAVKAIPEKKPRMLSKWLSPP